MPHNLRLPDIFHAPNRKILLSEKFKIVKGNKRSVTIKAEKVAPKEKILSDVF